MKYLRLSQVYGETVLQTQLAEHVDAEELHGFVQLFSVILIDYTNILGAFESTFEINAVVQELPSA